MTPSNPMLVLLAQQGDREALNRLLESVQGRLYRYISGILSDGAAAEDALQETLLRMARKLPWLTEPRAFEAWAYRIASNEAARHARRALSRQSEPLDEELPAAEAIPQRLDPDELRGMIAGLSPASRAVVLLHYQEERPLDEIASVLALPLGTVKSRLAYGLKCLRERSGQ